MPYLEDWTSEFENDFCEYVGGVKAFSFPRGREALRFILDILEEFNARTVFVSEPTCKSVLDTIGCEIANQNEADILIATHLFGIPNPLEKKNGQWLIEDCAQCLGAELERRKVGTFGDAAIYSFGYDKPISMASGGMLVINNPKLLEKADLKTHGKIKQVNALIGLRQLGKINNILAERNLKAYYWDDFLDRKKFERWEFIGKSHPSYLRYPVFNKTEKSTEEITKICGKEGWNIIGWGGIKDLLCFPVHWGVKVDRIKILANKLNKL